MDLYVFATPYRITWDYYFSAREHTLKFDSWEEPAELEYVFFLVQLSVLFESFLVANPYYRKIIFSLNCTGKAAWSFCVSHASGNAGYASFSS